MDDKTFVRKTFAETVVKGICAILIVLSCSFIFSLWNFYKGFQAQQGLTDVVMVYIIIVGAFVAGPQLIIALNLYFLGKSARKLQIVFSMFMLLLILYLMIEVYHSIDSLFIAAFLSYSLIIYLLLFNKTVKSLFLDKKAF